MTTVRFLGVGAALPAPGATNCAYLVEGQGATLLVDCGPAILQQLAMAERTPGDISHLLFTHRHGDHALGYPMLLLWWKLIGQPAGRPLPTVAASAITWESLDALSAHSFGELTGEVAVPRVVLSDAPSAVRGLASNIRLRTYPMKHSTFAPVLGMRLTLGEHRVAFTGDTTITEEVVPLARDVDLLVCDSCHSATIDPVLPDGTPYHLTARQAGRYARKAKARHLALVHIGAEYAGRHDALVAEARAEFSGPVFAPEAGEVFALS